MIRSFVEDVTADVGKPRASGDDPYRERAAIERNEVNPARAGMIPRVSFAHLAG